VALLVCRGPGSSTGHDLVTDFVQNTASLEPWEASDGQVRRHPNRKTEFQMAAQPKPDARNMVEDPTWLIHDFNLARREVVLLSMTEEDYRRSVFLDTRVASSEERKFTAGFRGQLSPRCRRNKIVAPGCARG